MDSKRVLTIQDISCFGQCSLTVALPVISACGVETCVLPSALLSTHTMGFKDYTCLDLTSEITKILDHWDRENILFDAVYTGYLATAEQIDVVRRAFSTRLRKGGLKIVDPVMGDYGKLYPAFDGDFVDAMRSLCADADIILPNITEASLLTGMEYKEEYDEEYIDALLDGLKAIGAKRIVLKGVGYDKDTTGVVVLGDGEKFYYPHKRIARSCHGTGDLFASAFTGLLTRGESVRDAVVKTADFVVMSIENTVNEAHWYGVNFETCMDLLMRE
ncbi:MAG: pyridoxamine kinase [Bacteroides sp.]|nr:pyridoxamine kinase [Bacillota bacterium]MCM1393330.1 pyridoxamine kinase [[Eubacterium] siraeum]MCM1455910.1 pyridoxamine kinase [Bacteroides sp.]